jgi:hypothetical protein
MGSESGVTGVVTSALEILPDAIARWRKAETQRAQELAFTWVLWPADSRSSAAVSWWMAMSGSGAASIQVAR